MGIAAHTYVCEYLRIMTPVCDRSHYIYFVDLPL